MKRFRVVGVAGAFALIALLGTATSAQAAGPVPFTLNEQITLGPDGQPVLQTFTGTGPLCPSGTYVNTKGNPGVPPQAAKFTIITRSVYTCEDGSGSFNAMTEVVGTPVTDDFATITGSIQLLGGTGAFTDLIGHGASAGSIDFAAGAASVTNVGVVVRG